MNHDDTKSRLAGAVEAVRPEFGPTLRGRTLAAMAETSAPARSRRRLVAALAFAAVALAALGFVPVPTEGGKGALARAMAAMESAPSVFVRTYRKDPKTGVESERREWRAAGGLKRIERYEGGRLIHLEVTGRNSHVDYDPQTRSAEVGDWRHPDWAANYLFAGVLDHSFVPILAAEESAHGLNRPIAEFQESSLWGGTRDIVEMEFPRSISVPASEQVKVRYEFDSAAGRLLSKRSYHREGDSWIAHSWTEEVNWDVEIPEETWTFTPPPGTKVTVNNRWWSQHPGEPLAVGRTKDWELTLYSMDRDQTGCLDLAVGWRSPSLPTMGIGGTDGFPCATVTDDTGGVYVHEPHGFGSLGEGIAIMQLHPQTDAPPSGDASTVTVTLRASNTYAGCGEESTQDVTFPNLPLPPVRDGDLWATHEIQY